MIIADMLSAGPENAKTARELADAINVHPRVITARIEEERRRGARICANSDGFYLASDDQELERYCALLKHRAIQIFTTRQALLNTIK